jgi:hypothetical protein
MPKGSAEKGRRADQIDWTLVAHVLSSSRKNLDRVRQNVNHRL